MLVFIKSSMAGKLREVILSLRSTLVRPHLECCAWLWSPQHKKGIDLLEHASKSGGLELPSCAFSLRVGAVQPAEEQVQAEFKGGLQESWEGFCHSSRW